MASREYMQYCINTEDEYKKFSKLNAAEQEARLTLAKATCQSAIAKDGKYNNTRSEALGELGEVVGKELLRSVCACVIL